MRCAGKCCGCGICFGMINQTESIPAIPLEGIEVRKQCLLVVVILIPNPSDAGQLFVELSAEFDIEYGVYSCRNS
jgi:hypothetical protein